MGKGVLDYEDLQSRYVRMLSQSTEPYLFLGTFNKHIFIRANCRGQAKLYGYTGSPGPPLLALAPNTLLTWDSSFKLLMLRNGQVFSEHIHIQHIIPADCRSWHWPLIIMVSKHQQYQKGVTTYRNGPERTKKDWNGHTKIPKQISMGTKTDFSGHRNRPEQTSAHTETNFNGNQKR